MKDTRLLMGMPITVEIIDENASKKHLDRIYDYFDYIDHKFSTYKNDSEISFINQGVLTKENYSADMQKILDLCEQTKKETNGYFDINNQGKLDPSGLVKGWSIYNASQLIKEMGFKNYFVDAGGDIQIKGRNHKGNKWKIGIRNPFNRHEVVKKIVVDKQGVATSGTYIRGQHIYNPYKPKKNLTDILSITLIGPNIYEADRFATACFAMGRDGINFIAQKSGFEAYMIDKNGIATFTPGFNKFVTN